MLTDDDVVLTASYSGTTEELVRLAEILKRLAASRWWRLTGQSPTAADGASSRTSICPVPIDREACPLELAPTASTTATLALGDALAMALLEAKGFSRDDFKRNCIPAASWAGAFCKVAEI